MAVAVNNGGTVTMTGNDFPVISFPAASDPVTGQPTTSFTIPLRTPFALTGAATDPQGDTILYAWEQNDRGGAPIPGGNNGGTSLLNNVKPDGPLFAMFPRSAPISETDTLQYNSPNQNHVTPSPTRVFPDLEQILANNTNAETGTCPLGPIAPPVPIPAPGVLLGVPADRRLRRLPRHEPRPAAGAPLPLHRPRPADGRRRQQRP